MAAQNGYYYSSTEKILYVKSIFNYQPQNITIDKDTYAINENDEKDISIFPNPASDYIYLTSNSGKLLQSDIKLYNSAGVLLTQQTATNDYTERIDINSLPYGIYFVKVTNGTKTVNLRLIKQ